MRLVYLLLPILIIGISTGYTLPGHNVKGDINMYGNAIYNSTTPVNDTDLATKQYVDNITVTGYLPLEGGTLTGWLNLSSKPLQSVGTPSNDTDASTKKYVDDQISALPPSPDMTTKINKSGDTMNGVLNMSSNAITNLPNATSDYDPVTLIQLTGSERVTVGTQSWCTYITNGVADQVQLTSAIATGYPVYIESDLWISNRFNVTDHCIIEGQGHRITAEAGYDKTYMMVITGSNASVSDLTIDGNKSYVTADEWGITIEGTNNTIYRCNVEHVTNRGILVTGDYNDILHCEIYDVGYPGVDYTFGINMYYADYFHIEDCKVVRVDWKDPNSGGFGIYGKGVNGGIVTRCTVSDASDHIFFDGMNRTSIIDNEVIVTGFNSSGSYKIGIDLGRAIATGPIISRNHISGAHYGIYSEGCYDSVINDNEISNTEHGIYHYVMTTGTMFSNTMNGNKLVGNDIGSGIEIYQADDAVDNVKNNVMNDNVIRDFDIGIYGHASTTATNWGNTANSNAITSCVTNSILTTGGCIGWTVLGNNIADSAAISLAGTNVADHNG